MPGWQLPGSGLVITETPSGSGLMGAHAYSCDRGMGIPRQVWLKTSGKRKLNKFWWAIISKCSERRTFFSLVHLGLLFALILCGRYLHTVIAVKSNTDIICNTPTEANNITLSHYVVSPQISQHMDTKIPINKCRCKEELFFSSKPWDCMVYYSDASLVWQCSLTDIWCAYGL